MSSFLFSRILTHTHEGLRSKQTKPNHSRNQSSPGGTQLNESHLLSVKTSINIFKILISRKNGSVFALQCIIYDNCLFSMFPQLSVFQLRRDTYINTNNCILQNTGNTPWCVPISEPDTYITLRKYRENIYSRFSRNCV